MNQEEDNSEDRDYKNDLFIIFFDKLLSLYIKSDYKGIERILIGNNEPKIHKFVSNGISGTKYIDEDSIIDMRIWIDDETKRFLDVLHRVCKDENTIASLNNKMIELWLYEMNTEMSRFFYKARNIECNKDFRFTLKVEKQVWDNFVYRCGVLNIPQITGIKTCVSEFIQQKAKQYLP